jgi:hypothetical protein
VAQQAGQISPDGKWLWNGAQWVPYQQPPVAPVAVPWARPYESARHRTMWVSILLASTIAGVVLRARALTEQDPAVQARRFSVKVMPWIVPRGAMSSRAPISHYP